MITSRIPCPARSIQGVALVMTLAMLVLLTGLVLAFFQLVKTDLFSSGVFEKANSSRQLGETALNLVLGQIQEATEQQDQIWTSQPGLIRTFDRLGQPSANYKLYSAQHMRTAPGDSDFLPESDLPDVASWPSLPQEFVDLNAPVITSSMGEDGSLVEHRLFPIVDPRAAEIVDGRPLVEGFSYSADWRSDNTPERSVAMPVRWLYLLRDGSVVVPVTDPASSGAAVEVPGSSAANPPVARLAFWTDDETSKVNINTASEGTPWDSPVANTFPQAVRAKKRPVDWPRRTEAWGSAVYELDYAHFQPSQQEYQRYPGHPATTALWPIFGESIAQALGVDPTRSDGRLAVVEEIYKIAPRYSGGPDSSLGGTQRGRAVLNPGGDRLFATLDEMLYSQVLSTSGDRAENRIASESVERQKLLERSKFFATVSSKASEVNLFGKPRIAAWPVHANDSPDYRSAFDRLIAFCATVGSTPYYFSRSDPKSNTTDWNKRNEELFRYLQQLTETDIPGFGATFLQKFQQDRDQVLAEILDYIRCLNLQDVTVTQSYTTPTTKLDDALRGQVVPLVTGTGARGFGRVATVSEIAFWLVGEESNNQHFARLAIVPELFSPAAGPSAMAINMDLEFYDLDQLKILVNGAPLTFPNSQVQMTASHVPRSSAAGGGLSQSGQSREGGYMGVGTLLQKSSPPITDRLFVSPKTPTVPFTGIIKAGSKLKFRIKLPSGSNVIAQKFEYEFKSDVSLRSVKPIGTDTLSSRLNGGNGLKGSNYYTAIADVDAIVSLVPSGGAKEIQGDLRFVAAAGPNDNMADYFNVISNNSTNRIAHCLVPNYMNSYNGGRFGNLVKDKKTRWQIRAATAAKYSDIKSTSPDLPPEVNGVTNNFGKPGDWDNGIGLLEDGPYINKADEGIDTHQGVDDWFPYIGDAFSLETTSLVNNTRYSPNRQLPSPVMFGSLSTGIKRGQRWQTLLFRPALPALPGSETHPGAKNPPDHLLLDLFWMPVVEPYAISERFSTSGQINLNQKIAPFSYIQRNTALRSLLKSVYLTAIDPDIPSADSPIRPLIYRYKAPGFWSDCGMENTSIRFPLDPDATITLIEDRTKSLGRPYISASEICDIPLAPMRPDGSDADSLPDPIFSKGASASTIGAQLELFWKEHSLTGDNMLERPYAHLYPRLTTRSNAYTVHVRAQRLVVTPQNANRGRFDARRDQVASEFRGSYIIERYLDPNSDGLVVKDPSENKYIPATNERDPAAALGPYKFRVLLCKQLSQ